MRLCIEREALELLGCKAGLRQQRLTGGEGDETIKEVPAGILGVIEAGDDEQAVTDTGHEEEVEEACAAALIVRVDQPDERIDVIGKAEVIDGNGTVLK